MSKILCRDLDLEDCDLRFEEDGDGYTLTGYPVRFNKTTLIDSWEGRFNERVAPGATKRTINARMPIMQWNHGKDPAVGQVPIGVYREVGEDDRGLKILQSRLHQNAQVQPVRDAIASGAIKGMSVRMEVLRDSWDKSQDPPLRTIHEMRIHEMGPVAFPAYVDTSVGVRDADDDTTPDEPADEALRDGPGEQTDDSLDTSTRRSAVYARARAFLTLETP